MSHAKTSSTAAIDALRLWHNAAGHQDSRSVEGQPAGPPASSGQCSLMAAIDALQQWHNAAGNQGSPVDGDADARQFMLGKEG